MVESQGCYSKDHTGEKGQKKRQYEDAEGGCEAKMHQPRIERGAHRVVYRGETL